MKTIYFLFLSVLFAACSSVSEEDFKLLVEQGDITKVTAAIPNLDKAQKPSILSYGLNTAISNANKEIAMLLLENGALGDSRAFNKACKYAFTEVALKIFESNDEVGDYLDENGSSSLQFALAYGQKEAAKMLLTVAGQPVNMQSNLFNSPLHIAAEQGYDDIIPLLMNKGAEVNFKNPDGFTAIFSAIKKGRLEAVKVLIENNADLTVEVDFAGSKYSPLSWAQSSLTEAGEEIAVLLEIPAEESL